MKKVIITIMALCAIVFATSCNNRHHTTAEEAVENSIYASSENVLECYATQRVQYRVNGTTIVSKCLVSVSCDGNEFANTYRFVWWNQHGCCWQVAKNLREVAVWQQEETARKTALREWADTL
jgi:uncharacterized lipoprotein NlpE involved in copper resistance